MKTVKALVITGNGTNCERETAHACRLAGAETRIAHISELFSGKVGLGDYHFLNLPGGFLDGDDLGSAKAAGVRLLHGKVGKAGGAGPRSFMDDLKRFVDDGKLILGICNGFQLMVKMGLLPGADFVQTSSLTHNDSGRFEDRWVRLKVNKNCPCVYTQGLEFLYLPVRHGEGKFVTRDPSVLDELARENLIALQYADENGEPTMEYPLNPNGSVSAVSGIVDSTGRLFGLMPHPEAFLHRTNHPRWTREKLPEEGDGLLLYRNAVDFIRRELL